MSKRAARRVLFIALTCFAASLLVFLAANMSVERASGIESVSRFFDAFFLSLAVIPIMIGSAVFALVSLLFMLLAEPDNPSGGTSRIGRGLLTLGMIFCALLGLYYLAHLLLGI